MSSGLDNSGVSEAVLRRRKRKRERARERRRTDPEFLQRSRDILRKSTRKRRSNPERRAKELEYNKQRRLERRAAEPGYVEHVRKYDRELQNKRRKDDPDVLLKQRNSRYNVSKDQFIEIYNYQNGKCATCPYEFGSIYSNKIYRDHEHVSGLVRGLLCSYCNQLLGRLEQRAFNISNYISYVQRPTTNNLGLSIKVTESLHKETRKRKARIIHKP